MTASSASTASTRPGAAHRRAVRAVAALLLAFLATAPAVNCPGSGEIARLAPDTLEELDSLEYGEPYLGHVALSEEALWATVPRTELIAIDRQTGELAGRVDLGMQVADEIATGSGAVWATTYSGRVLKVDPDGTRIVAERHVGENSAQDVAAGGEGVWVADAERGSALLLDPATLETRKRVSLPGPGSREPRFPARPPVLAVDLGAQSLWVASYGASALVRYQPVADELHRQKVEQVSDVAAASGAVWVNHGSNETPYNC